MVKLVCFLLLSCTCAQAQRTSPFPEQTTFLRFNFLGLVDPSDMYAGFGAERMVKPSVAVSADLGYIYFSNQYPNAKSATGFIVRPAIRYYTGQRTLFFEGELQFKMVTNRIEDWLGKNAVNGVPGYEEFTTFRYRRNVSGFHIKCGRVLPITADRKLWWEVYAGIGLRRYSYKVLDNPRSVYEYETWFGGRQRDEVNFAIAVPFGVRLLWKAR
jgi:hypothetical protein